jgi:AcrR family transcriptional regulator
VSTRGLTALSFSAVADDVEVTRTAPLYYFGSRDGLLAAIAEYSFDELMNRLREQRAAGDESERTVKKLASTYADYAFRNPELYRVMHASDLWQAATVMHTPKRMTEASASKAEMWIQRAVRARNTGFREFISAIKAAQAAGRLRKEESPWDVAHVVTAIVDGFLFHYFQEYVARNLTLKARLAYVDKLLDLAFGGLFVSSGKRSNRAVPKSRL